MVMDHRNSIGARLLLMWAGMILILGATVILSISRLAAFSATAGEITAPRLADAWTASVSESMRHARNTLIMDDKAQIEGELEKITALAEQSAQYEQTLTGEVQTPDGKALLQEAAEARSHLVPTDRQFLSQVASGDIKAAKELLLQEQPEQLALLSTLSQLGEYQSAQMHRRADELASSYRSTRA
jgi:hypothetical protein